MSTTIRTRTAIEVSGLAKSYKSTRVLLDVSFTVDEGTVFALLGANGSGKTTIINVLTTSITADCGTVRVAGFDVAAQPGKVRESISVTGQFAAVDHVLTARENLILVGQLRHIDDPQRTANDLLDRFSLTDAADRRTATFSGGMRRRLDLAMSLVGDAPIVFFDEPTTGLDPKSRHDMWHTIATLVEHGTTVFLTTQYLEEADRLADRVAILHHGRIAACGTPAELKAALPSAGVDLDFADPDQLNTAATALAGHPTTTNDLTLSVATDGSVATTAEIFTALRAQGIEPSGFSARQPTLDDVFFEILDTYTNGPEEATDAHHH